MTLTVTAVFVFNPVNAILQGNKNGAGSGAVTSLSMAGIDCVQFFPNGALVSLQAIAGFAFAS